MVNRSAPGADLCKHVCALSPLKTTEAQTAVLNTRLNWCFTLTKQQFLDFNREPAVVAFSTAMQGNPAVCGLY